LHTVFTVKNAIQFWGELKEITQIIALVKLVKKCSIEVLSPQNSDMT